MKQRTFRYAAWILVILTSGFLYAQPQTISRIPLSAAQWDDYRSGQVGSSLLLAQESMTLGDVWQVHLATGEPRLLRSDLVSPRRARIAAGGVFLTVHDTVVGGHRIAYVDTLGRSTFSPPIDGAPNSYQQPLPQHPCLLADRYYLSSFQDGQYCVWESDGTEAGSRVIFRSEAPVLGLTPWSGPELLGIWVRESIGTILYRYDGQEVQEGLTFSREDFDAVVPRVIGQNEAHLYLECRDTSYRPHIWRTDMTLAGTSRFLRGTSARRMLFGDDGTYWLHQREGFSYSQAISRGHLSDATPPVKLLAPGLERDSSAKLLEMVNERYFRWGSWSQGIEWGYWDSTGAPQQVEELVPGVASAIGGAPQAVHTVVRPPHLAGEQGEVYTVVYRPHDERWYVYRIDGAEALPLFELPSGRDVARLWLRGHHLYWLSPEGDTTHVMRYDLRQPPQATPTDPTTLRQETWHRQLAVGYKSLFLPYESESFSPQLLQDDKDGNLLVGFLQIRGTAQRVLYGEGMASPAQLHGSQVFVKYDRHGKLLWQNSLGRMGSHFILGSAATLDTQGDIVAVGNFGGKGAFDGDTLRTNEAGIFLVKLDGQTGHILWKRLIATGQYSNTFVSDEKLVTDEDGRIYLPFLYRDFRLNLSGTILQSKLSPANALACFDKDGSLVWAKNTLPPWRDYYGRAQALAYDQERQQLITIQSQGSYHFISSCRHQDWRYFLQRFDRSGTLIDTFSWQGNDLGGMVDAAYMSSGRLIATGFYRGTLDLGHFSMTTPPHEEGCTQTEGFSLAYDMASGQIPFAQRMPNFWPLEIKVHGEHVYYLGTTAGRRRRLTLLKYSLGGAFIGQKPLEQRADPFNFEHDQRLAVSDEYVTVLGTNFTQDAATGAKPLLMSRHTVDILRMRNEGWDPGVEGFQPAPFLPGAEAPSVAAYPNPFSEYVRLVLDEQAAWHHTYHVFTLEGRSVAQGPLNGDLVQELDLRSLSAGMYMLRLEGGGPPLSLKLIKR